MITRLVPLAPVWSTVPPPALPSAKAVNRESTSEYTLLVCKVVRPAPDVSKKPTRTDEPELSRLPELVAKGDPPLLLSVSETVAAMPEADRSSAANAVSPRQIEE